MSAPVTEYLPPQTTEKLQNYNEFYADDLPTYHNFLSAPVTEYLPPQTTEKLQNYNEINADDLPTYHNFLSAPVTEYLPPHTTEKLNNYNEVYEEELPTYNNHIARFVIVFDKQIFSNSLRRPPGFENTQLFDHPDVTRIWIQFELYKNLKKKPQKKLVKSLLNILLRMPITTNCHYRTDSAKHSSVTI